MSATKPAGEYLASKYSNCDGVKPLKVRDGGNDMVLETVKSANVVNSTVGKGDCKQPRMYV